MYLRTPDRYRPGRRNRRYVASLKWLPLWVITPLIVWAGLHITTHRDQYSPRVVGAVDGVLAGTGQQVATLMAPTPAPTENPTGRLARANASWSGGRIEEALRDYQAIIGALPNDVNAHVNLAMGLLVAGRNADALAAAENAVTADPYSAEAWAVRALALTRNGQPVLGAASAQHALELDPTHARAMAFMAQAYLEANQPARAQTLVDRALQADPASPDAFYARGLVRWLSRFEVTQAMTDLREAYALAPNRVDIGIQMAWLDYGTENPQAAVERLGPIVELNPQNVNALYALGYIYRRGLGDPNRAADTLERCVQVLPSSTNCQYELGRAYLQAQRAAEAAEAFGLALRAGSTDPYHYWWAAEMQFRQDNCAGSIATLQQGLTYFTAQGNPTLFEDYQASLGRCRAFAGPPGLPPPTEEAAPLEGDAAPLDADATPEANVWRAPGGWRA